MLPARSIVATLAVIVGLGAWWALSLGGKKDIIALNSPLPAFSLKPIEGIENSGFDSTALEGHYSLVNAFASWCIPCRDEHPLLIEVARQYQVPIFGMNVTDLPENAVSFLERLGNPYNRVGADTDKTVASRLGLVGLPHTFVIDPTGRLLMSHPGPISRNFIDKELPKLLAEKPR